MAVFKIDKNSNYTVMNNYHLRDKKISLKAKGLLSFMFSLPENWDYSLNGLVAVLKEEETAIKNTLNELEAHRYLKIDKIRNGKGQFEYIYNIYEIPYIEKPQVENLGVDNPQVENQTQINTNIINTKKEYSPAEGEIEIKEVELADNFDKIWNIYPRKDGKNTAFTHYKAWLNGKRYAGRIIKLTNKQMWYATKKYADFIKETKTEKKFIKMGSTFFNEAIMEYVEEENE